MSVKLGSRFVWFLVMAAVVIFCNSNYSFAAGMQQFSADMISHASGKTENAKVYVSDNKMRNDIAGNIMIMRLDKNVMWMITPADKMYMEMPIDNKMIPKASKEIDGEIERVSLGKETIDGTQTEKFKVTYNKANQQEVMYQWVTDSGFPIKMEAVDGSWGLEYKNISFGPPADSLFEVPDGYQKMVMPSFGAGSGKPSLDDIVPPQATE